ncbi:MAG: sensor domain-containing diguanylate cyclase, partial [Acidimicrobiia bacterium]
AGTAAATRVGVVYPGETGVEPAAPEPERPTAMAVPFFSRGDLLGVVAVYGHPSRTFGLDDLSALETLVNQAGTAVDNVSLHQEAQRLSITDGLTGLWNRRQLELRCREELDRAVRFNRSVGLVFIDVDKFKDVNDEWLHPGGDAVLVELARRLAGATREIDVVARWGGEEFVLLLPETDLGGSMVLAEKVRREVGATPITHAGKSRTVTVSAGVAAYPHSGTNVRTLVNAASEAVHRAKQGGRNRVEQAEPNIRQAPPPAGGGAEAGSEPRDGSNTGAGEGGTT